MKHQRIHQGSFSHAALAVVLVFLSFPPAAWAYVDPGSITILLQVVGAFILGSLITFRNQIRDGIKRLFNIGRPREASSEEESKDDTND